MEAWGLGIFMVSAGLCTVLVIHPASPLATARPSPPADADRQPHGSHRRRHHLFALGPAVGCPSEPGRHADLLPSGQGRRLGWLYVVAQILGGLAGVLLVLLALCSSPTRRWPISPHLPGPAGSAVAFVAEALISFGLMLMVLLTTNSPRLDALHRPLRGLPRRPLHHRRGPALGHEHEPGPHPGLPCPATSRARIYLTAPPLGMLLAVEAYRLIARTPRVLCAKLNHHTHRRCIFRCGYQER